MNKQIIPQNNRLVEIEREIQESEGLITEDQEREIEAIIAADLIQAGRAVVSIEQRQEHLVSLIKKAKLVAEYLEQRAGMYRDAMARLMSKHANGDGKYSLKDSFYSASLTKSKGRVVVFDADSVPRIYWKRTITEAPDTALIRSAIESGMEVKGAMIEGADEKHVRIVVNKDAVLQAEIKAALE